jgi:hypothetical protein
LPPPLATLPAFAAAGRVLIQVAPTGIPVFLPPAALGKRLDSLLQVVDEAADSIRELGDRAAQALRLGGEQKADAGPGRSDGGR